MIDERMNAEPLNGKEQCRSCYYPHPIKQGDKDDGCNGRYKHEDVAAAVQHLKKKMKQDMGFSTMLGKNEQQVLLDLVDEAFADVVDNSKNGDR